MIRTSEWVSLGHPDKIADYIVSVFNILSVNRLWYKISDYIATIFNIAVTCRFWNEITNYIVPVIKISCITQ